MVVKRFSIITILLIVLYSMYYDLTIGTLPSHTTTTQQTVKQKETVNEVVQRNEPFQAVIVEPGQTVLSIVEQLHEGPIRASISEIIFDFKHLNNGIEPENIQIGQSYFFPIYD